MAQHLSTDIWKEILNFLLKYRKARHPASRLPTISNSLLKTRLVCQNWNTVVSQLQNSLFINLYKKITKYPFPNHLDLCPTDLLQFVQATSKFLMFRSQRI